MIRKAGQMLEFFFFGGGGYTKKKVVFVVGGMYIFWKNATTQSKSEKRELMEQRIERELLTFNQG